MSTETQREKPYDFTPLPEEKGNNQPIAEHHIVVGKKTQPLLSGTLTGIINAESLVHIASGFVVPMEDILRYGDIEQDSVRTDKIVASHMRSRDVRVIPGSTIKGLIRSAVEAITIPSVRFETKPKAKKVRGVEVVQTLIQPQSQKIRRSLEQTKLSLANRLFGLSSGRDGYQGQCSFYDAPQISGSGIVFRRLPLWSPQPDFSQAKPEITTDWNLYFRDRYRKQVRGRKFYRSGASKEVQRPYNTVECCSVGSQFSLRINFSNLTEGELGILLIVLGVDSQIPRLKVGGGKPVSMGAVTFTALKIQIIEPTSYEHFDTVSTSTTIEKFDKFVQAAQASGEPFEQGLEKLSDIMSRPAAYTAGGEERDY